MSKIDKTDIENIKLLIKEAKLSKLSKVLTTTPLNHFDLFSIIKPHDFKTSIYCLFTGKSLLSIGKENFNLLVIVFSDKYSSGISILKVVFALLVKEIKVILFTSLSISKLSWKITIRTNFRSSS